MWGVPQLLALPAFRLLLAFAFIASVAFSAGMSFFTIYMSRLGMDSGAIGFAWTLAREPDPSVLELVDSTYVGPETELVGAGGEEVWTFRAVGEGSTELELSYERSSGETSGEPFSLSVTVAA